MELNKYAEAFGMLADETRLRIIMILQQEHGSCVNDLARMMSISQPMVSYHLKALRSVGLVCDRKVGTMRIYELNSDKMRVMKDWLAGAYNLGEVTTGKSLD